jgi:hypothetical protein
LLYGSVDLGYSVFKNDRVRFGAFIGYHYWSETANAHGCRQTGGNPAFCVPEIPTSVTVITEKDDWHTIRLGGVIDVKLTKDLVWNGEMAFAMTSHRPLDIHYFTFGEDPAKGHGTGFQAESVLSYQINEKVKIGIGGRWWHFKTDAVDMFGQLLKYSTDRYGAFVQGSYKF